MTRLQRLGGSKSYCMNTNAHVERFELDFNSHKLDDLQHVESHPHHVIRLQSMVTLSNNTVRVN